MSEEVKINHNMITVEQIPTKEYFQQIEPYCYKVVIDCGYDGKLAKQVLHKIMESFKVE